ncbi:DNA recombination protein RmuC [Janthinobacterium sp. GB1R12]|uniref:DNA recombination protein RmuC n=1 Tax=Janthinobacterium sp. GB1R12 TaxID=3424190 RepID=UPI003F237E8B
METQSSLHMLLAFLLGLVLSAISFYFITKRAIKTAADAAQEQGRSAAAIEIATLTERMRLFDAEREQIVAERNGLSVALDNARNEGAKIGERAMRVQALDAQIEKLLEEQQEDRLEILRLAKNEAEKNQSLLAVSGRLAEVERECDARENELLELRQQTAGLREQSGRLNAEIKAGIESISLIRESFQREQELRSEVEVLMNKISGDLAFANQQLAVAENDARRIPAFLEKIAESERILADVRQQVADLREVSGRVNAELKAERELGLGMRTEWQMEKSLREQSEARGNKLSNEVAEITGLLESERRQADEKLAILLEAKESLTNQFKSLANDILDEKSKKFTEQNQVNIGQLLDPLRTKLHEFQGKVEEVYVQEGKDRSALAEQVRQLMDLNQVLSQDAKNLTSALKGSSKTQGNWGELILERVLEASGLRKGHEYDVQESHVREDGTRAQPDVVVHLPEDRHLIVDAKVSLLAYEACVSAEDDNERQLTIRRHLDSVRAHMKGLSSKNYQTLYGLKSLDFVLMFVPIEPAFMMAITHDQDLYMEALSKNVLLVSPSTLLFVVRTVAHLWRQEAQSRNAQDIAKRGAELYDRLSAFVVDLEKVGDRLRLTQESYSDARNKLYTNKGNVIRQAEMLKQLGVKPTKSMPSAVLDIAMVNEDMVGDNAAIATDG